MRFKVSINLVGLDQQWLPCENKIDQQAIQQIISVWLENWNIPFTEEELQEEDQDKELIKQW